MTRFQKALLFASLLLSLVAVFQLVSLSRKVDNLASVSVATPSVPLPASKHEAAVLTPVASDMPVANDDRFVRGEYVYSYLGTFPRLYFDDCLIEVGMITEYGKCIDITPTHALCVDQSIRTFLLPVRRPAGPPKTTAFAPAAAADGMSAF